MAGETHALLVGDFRAGLDAEHRIVRAVVLVAHVVNVVRRDDLEVEFLGELEEAGDDLALLRDAVVLDFDEVVFAAEDFHEATAGPSRLLVAVVQEVLRDERGEAAGEADQAVGVFREGFKIGARFVVKTLQMRVGNELQEILVAGEILRDEAEMKHALAVLVGAAVFLEAGGFNEVEFAADDRLDALGLGGVVELDRTVKIAVVGEREGLHPQLRRAIHQPVDPARAVEEAVVGMDVEVDEILIGGRHGDFNQAVRRAGARRERAGAGLFRGASVFDASLSGSCPLFGFLRSLLLRRCLLFFCRLLPRSGQRKPGAKLIVHSDRGTQFASAAYRRTLATHGLVASMSRRGNCYDNAFIESFWSS